MYRQLVLDRADDAFSLVHPDPERRPGPSGGEEGSLPRRGRSGGPPGRRDRGVSRSGSRRCRHSRGTQGPLHDDSRTGAAIGSSAPSGQPDGRWPTFAGSFTRTKVVPEPIDAGSLQWRSSLDRISPTRSSYPYSRSMTLQPVSLHSGSSAGLSPDCSGRPGDRLRRLQGCRLQPQRSPRRPRRIGDAGDRARLEARPREHGPAGEPDQHRGFRGTR